MYNDTIKITQIPEFGTCTKKDTRAIGQDVKAIVLEAGLFVHFEGKVYTVMLYECRYWTSWLFHSCINGKRSNETRTIKKKTNNLRAWYNELN